MNYANSRTHDVVVYGADDHYQEVIGGELLEGRWFTKNELKTGAAVAVLQEKHARQIFGRENPIEKIVQIGGRPLHVIGLYQDPANIFSPPGQEIGAILPFQFTWHAYNIDKTNALFFVVKPKPGVTVANAEDAVTIAMREMRRLRPADRNNFDLLSQDQVLFRYCTEEGKLASDNGSTDHIAGICNAGRNVFGMMPHPERASETILGNTDGLVLFQSIYTAIKEPTPV